jgi:hypothetical protein
VVLYSSSSNNKINNNIGISKRVCIEVKAFIKTNNSSNNNSNNNINKCNRIIQQGFY